VVRPAKGPGSRKKAVELADEVERFIVFCRAKGLQPSTINRSYGMALRRILLPFCAGAGVTTMEQLTPQVLAAFTADLHGRELSKHSVAAYVRSVNRFLSWYGIKEPADKAPRPRTRKVHRDVLTLKEMRQLEQAAPTVRNQLIIRVLADTGCRLGEAAAIRLPDVVKRGREWYILINGKTGERKPPISEDVYSRLKHFSEHVRPHAKHDYLFTSSHRDPQSGDWERLEGDGMYQAVKDVAAQTEWKRRIYPHLLRHSWITHMEARGVDPAIIAEVAGVSIEVIVRNYSHLSDRDRHQAIMDALTEEA
jgi:integrase/recombinase XerD